MTTLPQGWAKATLEDVAEIGAGNPAPQGEGFFKDGALPFVRVYDMGRLGTQREIFQTRDRLTAQAAEQHAMRLFPSGTVLFTKSGASTLLNQRAILAVDAYVVSHIGVAIPESGILPEWVFLALSHVDFAEFAKATTLPSFRISEAAQLPVRVPPTAEQKRIIAELDAIVSEVDFAILCLVRQSKILVSYRAAVLKAACEGRLVPTEAELARAEGREFEPADKMLARARKSGAMSPKRGRVHVHSQEFREELERSRRLPDGWSWEPLDGLCAAFVDCPHDTPEFFPEGYPTLRPRDVVGGTLRIETAMRVSEEEYKRRIVRLTPEAGDIAYSRELSYGWAVVIPPGVKLSLCQGLVVFRLLSPVSPAYVHLVLNGPVGRIQADEAATGTANPHVNVADIRDFRIPTPPEKEQNRIVAEVERRLSVVEQLEAAIERSLQRAARLRQAILKQAFEGKLVPQDPNDEPASVLLERIRKEREGRDVAKREKRAAARGVVGGSHRATRRSKKA